MQPNEVPEETPGDEVDSTGTACGENPKSNKPLMEKRRRARINKSLNELKGMLLHALKGNSCGHSKLEKADILEMTVRYMRKLEQHRARTTRIDPAVLNKYKAGFSECRNEVMKFLSTHEGVSVEVRTRLLDHLASCQQSLQGQDQEDFIPDEFIAIDHSPPWRASPMQAGENATRLSPSTIQATSQENDHRDEEEEQRVSESSDARTTVNAYVEGQIQILTTCTPSSPSHASTFASPLQSPFKDVAIGLPSDGAEHGLLGNMSRTEGVIPCPVYLRGIPAVSASSENFPVQTPALSRESLTQTAYGFATRGEDLPFPMGYLLPLSHVPESNFRSVPHSSRLRNFDVAPSAQPDAPNNNREDRRDEYSQREKFFMQHGKGTGQDARNHKGPWRPWSYDAS